MYAFGGGSRQVPSTGKATLAASPSARTFLTKIADHTAASIAAVTPELLHAAFRRAPGQGKARQGRTVIFLFHYPLDLARAATEIVKQISIRGSLSPLPRRAPR